MGKTHIADHETLERVAIALESMGASTVPIFNDETGRYTNASIAAWLAKMAVTAKNYGVSIPQGKCHGLHQDRGKCWNRQPKARNHRSRRYRPLREPRRVYLLRGKRRR